MCLTLPLSRTRFCSLPILFKDYSKLVNRKEK